MKLEIKRKNIITALAQLEKISGKKLTLPILSDVLFKAFGNSVKLTTTDLEIAMEKEILAKILKEGSLTVPVKSLFNILSFLNSENIILEKEKNQLLLKGVDYLFKFPIHHPKDFPVIPKVEKENLIKVEKRSLFEALVSLVNIPNINLIKPEFSGVFFRFNEKKLTLVATDSFRLAEKKLEAKGKKESEFILPLLAVKTLIDLLKEAEEVKIYPGSNLVLFEVKEKIPSFKSEIISKTIEGEFPAYEEIIPQKYQTELLLKREDFLNKIKLVSYFSGRTNEIKLKIFPQRKKMEILSSSELGEGFSSFEIEGKGKDLEISFNCKFLSDGLGSIKERQIEFKLTDKEGPAILKSPSRLDYLYILMPIKSY